MQPTGTAVRTCGKSCRVMSCHITSYSVLQRRSDLDRTTRIQTTRCQGANSAAVQASLAAPSALTERLHRQQPSANYGATTGMVSCSAWVPSTPVHLQPVQGPRISCTEKATPSQLTNLPETAASKPPFPRLMRKVFEVTAGKEHEKKPQAKTTNL